jgi:hypothetical protein
MATPKKSGSAAKKTTTAKKPAAKKPAAKKPAAKKAEKSSAPKKPAAKKAATAPKAAAKKAPAKKAPAKATPAKKAPATKAKAKAKPKVDADHDHDHAGHDHDHDHDEEHDEEQDRLDIERMGAALMALDDDALRHGLEHMSEKTRSELAGQLQLPRATMHLGDALIPLVRRKLHTVSPDRQLQAAFGLSECANDETVESLGERAEDPSLDDLREVLPPVVEAHGAPLVTAMLAAYSASNAPCRPVMRELLEIDDRFVIGSAVAVDAPAPAIAVFKPVIDEAKREQRREAKAAKKAAEAKAREARAAGEASRRAAVHKSKRKHGR